MSPADRLDAGRETTRFWSWSFERGARMVFRAIDAVAETAGIPTTSQKLF